MNPFHSPQELQYYTNIGHWFEGIILGIVAIIYLIQLLGYLRIEAAKYLVAALILLGGLFLSPYLLLHHGINNAGATWYYVVNDPAQLQHFIMGNILLVVGLVEILIATKALQHKLWSALFPLSVAIIGILFLVHPQHGTGIEFVRATRIHHYLGCLLITGGIAQAIALQNNRYRKLSYLWVVALIISTGLLFGYREPSETHDANPKILQQQMMQKGHH